ncbi:putative membrane protein [Aneurinibacillus soli]|uniref:Uncharacterized protein n=2 Tax=Aneurinibacillus soli TaxID=1500254 RepID=A0A0U5BHW8_9BACL|nr:DUF2085 domain-containing protein [Aneurinibacillus soli]PYE61413.1 putative membrane protein [Aneurinibacillus soli]BAU27758.1 hypothetical protein CB4_01932 [Aneurinibacillus soli]
MDMNNLLMKIPCHRKPSRSFFINGKQMPLCARCTSIFLGYLAIPFLLFFYPNTPLYVGFVLQIPILIDGFTQLYKWRESTNWLRFITGILSGIGQSAVIVSISMFIIKLVLTVAM